MKSRAKPMENFVRAFDEVDDVNVRHQVELSQDEVAELQGGIDALPDPVRAACQVVLDEWRELDGQARVAALLTLANALATAS